MSTKVKLPRWSVCLWLLPVTTSIAADFSENFATAPTSSRWSLHGDTSLFQWNESQEWMEVTWDSSKTNSYFHRPLPTILGKSDDFSLSFKLRLRSVEAGVDPGKPGTFEIAIGFLNRSNAFSTNFFRGTGNDSPNLVELDYFPDTGFGETLWPSFWSTNSILNFSGGQDFTLIALPLDVWLDIRMNYRAETETLSTSILADGESIGAINPVTLNAGFTDFRVDALAIMSYSDHRAGGSLLATGDIDDIAWTVPPPPVTGLAGRFEDSTWTLSFQSRTNWSYRLERTEAFGSWQALGEPVAGTGGQLELHDPGPFEEQYFYRVLSIRQP